MLKKNFCLSFLVYFISLTIYAQKNLRDGVVIFNNSTDTIKGLIDYKDWLTNPSSILFTSDRSLPVRRLGPDEINYFEVTGQQEQYRRYTVKISKDEVTLSNIGDKDTSSETKSAFLKILVTGKNVSLFSYKDKLKTRYYVQDGNNTPVELLNSTYVVNNQVVQEGQYRNTLQSIAVKYSLGEASLISQIDNARYYRSDIEDICLKLNGGSNNIQQLPFTRTHKELAIFAGVGINNGIVKLTDIYFADNGKKSTYYPVITAGADLAFNPGVRKFNLRAQVHVTGFKTSASTFRDFTQYTEQYDFKFSMLNISLDPQLLYYAYNGTQFKWFINGGLALNFSSYPKNELTYTRTSSTTTQSTKKDYVTALKTFWMTPCIGTGINLNKLQLAIIYFPKTSLTQPQTARVDNTSLQLHLNFFILQ